MECNSYFDRYVVNSASEMSSRLLEWFRGFPVPVEGVDARGDEFRYKEALV